MPYTVFIITDLSTATTEIIRASVLAVLVPVLLPIIAVILISIVIWYRRRSRVFDAPTNYNQRPLPPAPSVRMDSAGINDTNTNNNSDGQPQEHVHNVIHQHESTSLDGRVVSPDSEDFASNSSTTTPTDSPLSNEENDNTVIYAVISQPPAINPDAVVSARVPSTTHLDLSSERADLPLNVEDGDTTDESTRENANEVREIRDESTAENLSDELRMLSPNVAMNVSYQPSTSFNFQRNSAYGTNVAIAPEIETTENIAYEHSESNDIALPTGDTDSITTQQQ